MTDFVFSKRDDGSLRLVGNFEGLYRNELDPWGQSAAGGESCSYYVHSRARLWRAVDDLRRAASLDRAMRGLEIGCGHGHVTQCLSMVGMVWSGMDVSPAAITRARLNYPRNTFFVGDITDWERPTRVRYDMIVLGQCLWYVLHKMDNVVDNCFGMLTRSGVLIISQAYLTEQLYAKDICDGFAGTVKMFLDRFSDRFRLIQAYYDDSGNLAHNDGLLIFRKVEHAPDRSNQEEPPPQE